MTLLQLHPLTPELTALIAQSLAQTKTVVLDTIPKIQILLPDSIHTYSNTTSPKTDYVPVIVSGIFSLTVLGLTFLRDIIKNIRTYNRTKKHVIGYLQILASEMKEQASQYRRVVQQIVIPKKNFIPRLYTLKYSFNQILKLDSGELNKVFVFKTDHKDENIQKLYELRNLKNRIDSFVELENKIFKKFDKEYKENYQEVILSFTPLNQIQVRNPDDLTKTLSDESLMFRGVISTYLKTESDIFNLQKVSAAIGEIDDKNGIEYFYEKEMEGYVSEPRFKDVYAMTEKYKSALIKFTQTVVAINDFYSKSSGRFLTFAKKFELLSMYYNDEVTFEDYPFIYDWINNPA